MWTVQVSVAAKVRVEDLWLVWSDLARWKEWDPRNEWVILDGPIGAGQTGRAKFRGAPPARFEVAVYEAHRAFTIVAGGLGTTTRYDHRLEPDGEAVVLHHGVTVSGPMAPVLFVSCAGESRGICR